MKEVLNNGESKLSFRTKLNNMFTEIYNYLANLVTKSTGLSDMPNADALDTSPDAFLKVNNEGNAYELTNLDSKKLIDMPQSFLSQALKFLRLNAGATGYELVIPSTFNLSDMPTTRTGLAGYYLKVNAGATAYFLEKVKFIGGLDTPAAFTGAANKILKVNASANAVEFGPVGQTVTKTWYDNMSQRHDQVFTNGILVSWLVNGA